MLSSPVRPVTGLSLLEAGGTGEHRMMSGRGRVTISGSSNEMDITPTPSSIRWLHEVCDTTRAVATFERPILEFVLKAPSL